MKYKSLGLLLISLVLSGCKLSGSRSRASTATATDSTATANFAVTSIAPAGGAVVEPPTTVTITFNQNNLGPDTGTLGYYNLSCAGSVYPATAVQWVYGSNVVTVTLPTVGALSDGTACYFSLSPHVTNEYGYPTIGNRSAAYYISASATGSALRAAARAALAPRGGEGEFREVGGSAELLSGLRLFRQGEVRSIQAEYEEEFRTGGTRARGSVYGTAVVSFNEAYSCPEGMRITGLRGRTSGGGLTALGVVCRGERGNPFWESSWRGGSAGEAFRFDCPAGTFAYGLSGRSAGRITQPALLCR